MQHETDVYRHLLLRAAKDETFREALLRDPKATLISVFGAPLPESLNVNVVSNSANEITIVIPPKVSDALDEAMLDGVAGGINRSAFLDALFSISTVGMGCIISAIEGKGGIENCRDSYAAFRKLPSR